MTDQERVLRFRIHFTVRSGEEDSIVVEGRTLDDIREQAVMEVAKRGGKDAWSEGLR
jgi:acyl-coenzyme A thioesterase PaaI-like protein